MKFYLGTHEPSWLRYVEVPLFISRNRLARLKSLPRATTHWALDSGGFTELATHGRWTINAQQYAAEVRHYSDTIGMMDWAAPQDWMVEPSMLARTGLGVYEHQRRTVDNYLELCDLAPDLPWTPVLQGWTLMDYHRHVDMYPIDLTTQPLVGLGSVCRRQASAEIGQIVASLHQRGLALHGFGCKQAAICRYGPLLASADSLSWSYNGRRNGLCDKASRCANCLHFALAWRERTIVRAMNSTPTEPTEPDEPAPDTDD